MLEIDFTTMSDVTHFEQARRCLELKNCSDRAVGLRIKGLRFALERGWPIVELFAFLNKKYGPRLRYLEFEEPSMGSSCVEDAQDYEDELPCEEDEEWDSDDETPSSAVNWSPEDQPDPWEQRKMYHTDGSSHQERKNIRLKKLYLIP